MKMTPTLCGKSKVHMSDSGCNDCTVLEERVAELEEATEKNIDCCTQNTDSIEAVQISMDKLDKDVSDANTRMSQIEQASNIITQQLANKVDKVAGKGLSTNDFTDADKEKLANVTPGGEANQNAYSHIRVGDETLDADSPTATFGVASDSDAITIAKVDDALVWNLEVATCEELTDMLNSIFTPLCASVVGQAVVGCSAAD